MSVVLVAAGGGGDALAATIIHRRFFPADPPPAILTYAWERLRVDPLPGPRGPAGFTGLVTVGAHSRRIIPGSDTVPPGRSTLPRLAGEVDARFFLLDPAGGAVGMRGQVAELVEAEQAEAVWVVDVGGDALARGDEDGLRSPLADGMALAACASLPVPVQVVSAGPGLDGELPEADVVARATALGGHVAGQLTPDDVRPALDVLTWHPSEATALLVAAALGARGRVEIRGNASIVELTDRSADALTVDNLTLAAGTLYVEALAGTETLVDAEKITRDHLGISEIDYERDKAKQLSPDAQPASEASDLADKARAYATDARDRGVDFLTFRRVAEALDVSPTALGQLRADLPDDPLIPGLPLWRC